MTTENEQIAQAVAIQAATATLLQDDSFRKEVASQLAARLKADQRSLVRDLKHEITTQAKEDIQKAREALEAHRGREYQKAKAEITKRYGEAVKRWYNVHVNDDEIRKIAKKAIKDCVFKAFGKRAHQLACATLDNHGDRLELLLAGELEGGE